MQACARASVCVCVCVRVSVCTCMQFSAAMSRLTDAYPSESSRLTPLSHTSRRTLCTHTHTHTHTLACRYLGLSMASHSLRSEIRQWVSLLRAFGYVYQPRACVSQCLGPVAYLRVSRLGFSVNTKVSPHTGLRQLYTVRVL